MNALEWQLIIETRDALVRAKHGQKKAVIASACAQLQCSEQTLYRKLEEAGFAAGRKQRTDKGEVIYTYEMLRMIGGLLIQSTRQNGKQLLTIEDAVEILFADGKLPALASSSWVGEMLRCANLHPDQLRHLAPAQSLRSLHPNHVWQIDASVCVLYYMKSGALKSMPKDEFYKNKPHNLARIVNDLCTRYVATDHTSSTIWTRYFTGGETAQNLIDFFLWAVSQRQGMVAHGVPFMVMLDPGAANISHLFKNLCEQLQVKLQINEPGNPRAKGQVENAQNLVERHFEGLIRFMPTLDLEQLNSACERWQISFNAARKHTRHGMPRYSAWMHITPEQLRIAPALELMRELVTSQPETRRVSNTMTASFKVKGYESQDYDVRYVPGVMVGQQITVQVNAYRAPAIDVRYTDAKTGELRWMTVEPVKTDAFGFNAKAAVIGEEYKRPPLTSADHSRSAIGQEAYGVASDDEAAKARKANTQAYGPQSESPVNIMAAIDATPLPAYLPRKGTALETEKREVAEARMSIAAAAKQLKARQGDDYDPATFGWLTEKYGAAGITQAQVDGIYEAKAAPAQPEASGAPALRVVSGGQK